MKFIYKLSLLAGILLLSILFYAPVQGQSINTEYYYRLTNSFLGEGRMLEANSSSGMPIYMGFTGSGIVNGQKWKLTHIGNGKYRISNYHLGNLLCLDTYSQYDNRPAFRICGDNVTDNWTLVPAGGEYYYIIDIHGRALDNLAGGDYKPVMAVKGNYSGQFWKFTPLERIADIQNAIVVFDNPGYSGSSSLFHFNPDLINTPTEGINQLSAISSAWTNRISSIQIPGGYKVIAYKQPNFQGDNYLEMFSNWTALPDFADWDNQIASFRIIAYNAPVPVTKPVENTPVIPTTPVIPPAPANPVINTSFYHLISSKAHGEENKLNYSPVQGPMLSQNARAPWILEPVKSGSYQLEGTSYVWREAATPVKFRIKLFMNGKYWALSTFMGDYPILTEVSQNDIYQVWLVEIQPDGYYKISNDHLKVNNRPSNVLYCSSDKKLFLGIWEEAKSSYAKWKLHTGGPIRPDDAADKFDNKRVTITTVPTNQPMCLVPLFVSDHYSGHLISPCENNNSARFIFQKTINGSYFIKVESQYMGTMTSYYLDGGLNTKGETEEFDLVNPVRYNTWNIVDMRNGYFMITNAETNLSFEFVGADPYFPSRPNLSRLPARINLKMRENKYEQYWLIRE